MMPFAPISGSGSWDDAVLPEGEKFPVYLSVVDSHFLETMRIPLLFGRDLTLRDDADAPTVALVNETFAREAFGEANPVGRRFWIGNREKSPEIEIAGVFRDSKTTSLKRDTQAAVFFPYRQQVANLGAMTFLVRHRQSPESLIGIVREAVGQIDPNLPLYEVKTMTDQIDESMIQERQFARLSIISGALALLLTSIGLYGTLSASVSRRTQEIGLRIALGAHRTDILRSVMTEMFLVALGIGLGLAVAWGVTRWLSSMLFGLTATDPLTLSAATVMMVIVAAAAVFFPARRASRVDPVEALRFE
jgi:predicted permease